MLVAESLPATLRLGAVHLNVTDLDRTVAWYGRSLGLHLRSRGPGRAEMGDALCTSVVLHEEPDALMQDDGHAGIFHYCLRYETREEFALATRRLQEAGDSVTNMKDRHTHEAVYVPDLDGITVELAWDRPREVWPAEPYGHTPVPLDMDELLEIVVAEPTPPKVADGLTIGHVHFTVGDQDDAIRFYRDALGFDLRYHVSSGAFFSVGGYHHHVAANLRRGVGLEPQPPNAIGMRYWTVELPDAGAVEAARGRIEAAGYAVEPLDGGFVSTDASAIPVQVVG